MENLTELFCLMDDFCRRFEPAWEQCQLIAGAQKRRRHNALSLSELMTLVVLFHQSVQLGWGGSTGMKPEWQIL